MHRLQEDDSCAREVADRLHPSQFRVRFVHALKGSDRLAADVSQLVHPVQALAGTAALVPSGSVVMLSEGSSAPIQDVTPRAQGPAQATRRPGARRPEARGLRSEA